MKNLKYIFSLFSLLIICLQDAFPFERPGDIPSVYYVGGENASYKNPGTKEAPFATISTAAVLLKAGDTCYIRAGIYRETVVPANSGSPGNPTVYKDYGDGDVILSGADGVDGGWTVYDGKIYQKTISLPITGYRDAITGNETLLANQVFVDGKMMIEARWPNISNSDDLMNRDDFRMIPKGGWTSEVPKTIKDNVIPDIPGGWTGGTIWAIGWYAPGTNPVIEVRSDTMISILVNKIPWLTLRVINRTSGSSVYRAIVKVNEASYYSNSSGCIELGEYPLGSFHVSVSHSNY